LTKWVKKIRLRITIFERKKYVTSHLGAGWAEKYPQVPHIIWSAPKTKLSFIELDLKDEVIVKDRHIVDAIPEKNDDDITSGAYDDEPIDEGETSISHRTP